MPPKATVEISMREKLHK